MAITDLGNMLRANFTKHGVKKIFFLLASNTLPTENSNHQQIGSYHQERVRQTNAAILFDAGTGVTYPSYSEINGNASWGITGNANLA